MRTGKGLSWVIAILGLWELIAPFVLGFSTASPVALWNNIIVGAVLIVLGLIAALSANIQTDSTLDWVNAILGLWLILSPFILGFSAVTTVAMWDNIIVGIVVLVIGVWAALSMRSTFNRPVT